MRIAAPFRFERSRITWLEQVYEIWGHTVARGVLSGHCYRYQGLLALDARLKPLMVCQHAEVEEKIIATPWKQPRTFTLPGGKLIFWKWGAL